MRRICYPLLLCFLALVLSACLGGCNHKKRTVEKFVHSAVQYASKASKKTAVRTFNDRSSKFNSGGLYIFAYEYNGLCIAHGFKHDYIGKNLYNYQDPKGQYVIRNLIKLAKKGGGWYQYLWEDPINGKVEIKYGYVSPVPNQDYFIGSGYYSSIGR